MNKYNLAKSAQHYDKNNENVRRTYMMAKYKSYQIKNQWDNKLIIDADYYNNPDNEGHIYFQLINFSPFPILIKKGECFGQGIFQQYCTATSEEAVTATREGGFGSTNAK